MSDHFPITALVPPAASVPAERAERRQMRRAGISLQMRIRTADFNDGNFEEVRTTQNASRKAVYFFTKLNRYYKGMRVRITSPYDPDAGAGNLEQIGEVVRVHRKGDMYGVAIALSSYRYSAPAPGGAKPAQAQPVLAQAEPSATSPSERRCASRAAFIAPVEMVEMRSGSRIQARTSDLSPQGCYVDTLNPLPVGAAVRLQIQRRGQVLDVLAHVSSRHAGSGMGLVFAEIAPAQSSLLAKWLEELGVPPRAIFGEPFPASSKQASKLDDCAARLVQLLLRRGMLSQSEAMEVLRDLNE